MKSLLTAASMAVLLMVAPAWAQAPPSSSGQGLSAQDQQFLKEAGQGHQAEVRFGNLAAQRATMPAVRIFGRWMASAHGSANTQLATVIQQVQGQAPPMALTSEQQSEMQKSQGASGAAFDKQYLQMIAPDHQKDIQAFQKEAQGGQDQAVKTYAQNMLPVLQDHLAAVQKLMSMPATAPK